MKLTNNDDEDDDNNNDDNNWSLSLQSFTGRPPYSFLYTWAAVLTLLQVHLWEQQQQHQPAPSSAPSPAPICSKSLEGCGALYLLLWL